MADKVARTAPELAQKVVVQRCTTIPAIKVNQLTLVLSWQARNPSTHSKTSTSIGLSLFSGVIPLPIHR